MKGMCLVNMHAATVLTFTLSAVSMLVFILSSHVRSNIKETDGLAKGELIVFLFLLSFHFGVANYLFNDFELVLRTTLIGLTIIFGAIIPIVAMTFPSIHRIISLISMLTAMPFAWIGLALNVCGLINTWFFLIYFAVPLVIGAPWMYFALKKSENACEQRELKEKRT